MSNLLLSVTSLFLFCFIALTGCKEKVVEEYTIPEELKDIVALDITASTFNIPVTYSIKALETYLNHKLSGDFLETIIRPENKKKLEIGLSISKTSDIILRSNSKEIICTVPLKAVATVLNSGMNIISKGLKPVETELILELRTPASLDSRWNLVTKFDLVKTTWVKTPKLKVLGINFNLQKSIDKLLTEDEGMLTKLLDDEINKGVSLEKAVSKVWDDLQKPIPVSKKEPFVYLKFICDSIAGRFILSDTAVTCLTSINAQVGLVTDTTGYASVRKKLPSYVNNHRTDSLSDVHLHLVIGLKDINKELDTLIRGRSFTTTGMSLTIQKITVYGADIGMVIKLEATGSVNGEMIATAVPYFDSLTQHLSFRDFDFKVVSKNALLNIADALMHDMIRDSIQAGLGVELNSVLEDVPNIIHKALAKGKTGKTIDINVSDMRISSCALVMDSESIHLNVHTYFLAGIVLKQINPGKTLRIRPKEKPKSSSGRR